MQYRIKDNLNWLINNDPRVNGNVSRTSELIGIKQSTLQRISTGESESPRNQNVEAIAGFFNVTPSQLRGEEALPGRDSEPVTKDIQAAYTTSEGTPIVRYEINQRKLEKAIERLDQDIDNFCDRTVRNRARLIMMAYDSIKDEE